jgi:ABC-type iron transport system FetAB ATPase subunit
MAEDGGAGHLVELERVRKSFGDNLVLDDVDLTIDRGEVIVIVEASACWARARSSVATSPSTKSIWRRHPSTV